MDANIKDREKIAKQIAKTSESIRKKHRALKTGRIDEDIALERRFKPIVEPLKQIAEHAAGEESIKREANAATSVKREADAATSVKRAETDAATSVKRAETNAATSIKRKKERVDSDSEDDDKWFRVASTPTQTPRKKQKKWNVALPTLSSVSAIEPPADASMEQPTVLPREEIFASTPLSLLETTVRESMRSRRSRDALHSQLGPLGQKYMDLFLGQDRKREIDHSNGIYFGDDGRLMLGDKQFDLEKDDAILVDNVRYRGTRGLYELIFMKKPDRQFITLPDNMTYKSIIMATNLYNRAYKEGERIRGNRGTKYTEFIKPLISEHLKRRKGLGLPVAMTLTDNEIDYVHWDDPNELVDRLRLLDASRRAGNNAHDNEILSIVEELREAGIIIN